MMRRLILFTLLLLLVVQPGKMQDNPTFISALDWSPDSSLIAVGYGVTGMDYCFNSEDIYAIHIIDTATNQTQELKRHTCNVEGVSFSPDGEKLVSQGWDGRAVIWNLATGEHEVSGLVFNELYQVKWSHSGSHLLSVDELKVLISQSDELLVGITVFRVYEGRITNADWSPDDR
jgi:WD40 repeat protein